MAAQNNQAHLLANYSSHATNLISERLKANNRFSPYPVSSITGPIASTLGSASPTGIASAPPARLSRLLQILWGFFRLLFRRK